MAEHKHPTTVEGFSGTARELAENIAAMRYDKVHEFFVLYAGRLHFEGAAELSRGREKLAKELFEASHHATLLAGSYKRAFEISKPYMKSELGG